MQFTPIGTIRTPHKDRSGGPIQPSGAAGFSGRIELLPDYSEGLDDLDGFERILLVYHFHLSQGFKLKVKPFLDDTLRGVFSTRAPQRPNQIGISIVRLSRIDGTTLYIEDVDMLDKTPLIDIKPYVPKFDAFPDSKAGWLDRSGKSAETARSDNRFAD